MTYTCPECGADSEYEYCDSEYYGTLDHFECENGHEWKRWRNGR